MIRLADRAVKVSLTATVADFQAKMAAAAKAAQQVVDATAKVGKAAAEQKSGLAKIAEGAKENAAAWSSVSTTITATGTATLALAGYVAKVGISYNTLQQTSRAALTTMLGSAEAVNAQMDELDEFARSSPFSKAVWISAQQQMIGFGISASKVVTYMEAINDAVAATGGSNDDISEIVRIFSQIQSAAKITATDLMQFGQRGVDAATLIGSQMGKTGAQIREEITAGTLDAETALDALAAGMTERFGGASAAVKETMTGALDRVKAAFRDLASTMSSGLVDPNGGGALVDLTNYLADLMRTVEGLDSDFLTFVGTTTTLGGAFAVTTGGLMKFVPWLVSTRENIASLSDTVPRLSKVAGALISNAALGGVAGVLTAGVAALAIYTAQQKAAQAEIDELTATLDEQTGAITENTREWLYNAFSQDGDVKDAAADLGLTMRDLVDMALDPTNETLAELKARSAAVTEELNPLGEGANKTMGEIKQLGDENEGLFTVLRAVGEQSEKVTAAQEAQAEETEAVSDATAAATSASEDYTEALYSQYEAQRTAAGLALDLAEATLREKEATNSAKDSITEYNDLLVSGEASERDLEDARTDMEGALLDLVKAQQDSVDAMREEGASHIEVRNKISAQREEFINLATQMGYTREEAEALADSYGLIPTSITTVIKVNTDYASSAIQRFINTQNGRTIYLNVSASGATVQGWTGSGMRFKADGGVMEFYRAGGLRESHIAQIAPAGAMRVWAEPETGGEAYIPLAASKRARSTDILENVAARFGYSLSRFADGGYTRPTYSAPATVSPVVSQVSLDGARISGTLRFDKSGMAELIDGRISAAVTGFGLDARAGVR